MLKILNGFLGLSHLDSLFLWDWSLKIQLFYDIWPLSFRGCGGHPLALVWNIRVKSQMPTATEHAFKEKSTKLLILLPLRTIYFRTFQCETPCSMYYRFTRKKTFDKQTFVCIVGGVACRWKESCKNLRRKEKKNEKRASALVSFKY